MRAIVFDKKIEVTEVDRPERQPGEALIQVLVAGICNTDLEITRGYMDFKGIPGHEFVGIVTGCDTPELNGKRVVGEINAGCGSCSHCLSNDPRHCPDRTVLGIQGKNGAFAEYLTLPEKNLLIVDSDIDNRSAVFIEPLAAALQIFDENDILRDEEIAVIGDGKLGLLICHAAQARKYKPILYGINKNKLEIAANSGIETREVPIQNPGIYQTVIEASGSPAGFNSAMDLVEPRGTIILKSTYAEKCVPDFARIVVNEITIKGSRCGRFAPALELLRSNTINTGSMISGVYSLEQAEEAFKAAENPDTLKILLEIAK
jgi:threonine dehydrogenase-like Zn-dependent dehydrogenase